MTVGDWARRLSRRPANVIGYDFFDRGSTASTLGVTDSGALWFNSSLCKLVDGAAMRNGGSARVFALIHNINKPDEITVVIDTPASGDFDCGLVFRVTGSNTQNLLFVTCCKSTNDIKLFKRVSNTDTQVAQATTIGWQNNTRYVLTVRDIDGYVSVLVDGEEKIEPIEVTEAALTGNGLGLTFHHTRDTGARMSGLVWSRKKARRRNFAKVIAHRGAFAGLPENSLAPLGILPSNVDGVEIDAAQTADGVWVLMHDSTVDRTTNGTGAVASLQSDYVRSLLIDGGGGLVPTLGEFLDACALKPSISEVHIDYVSGNLAQLVALIMAHPIAAKCCSSGKHRTPPLPVRHPHRSVSRSAESPQRTPRRRLRSPRRPASSYATSPRRTPATTTTGRRSRPSWAQGWLRALPR